MYVPALERGHIFAKKLLKSAVLTLCQSLDRPSPSCGHRRTRSSLVAPPADASRTERRKKTPRMPPFGRRRPWRRRRPPKSTPSHKDKMSASGSRPDGRCKLVVLPKRAALCAQFLFLARCCVIWCWRSRRRRSSVGEGRGAPWLHLLSAAKGTNCTEHTMLFTRGFGCVELPFGLLCP